MLRMAAVAANFDRDLEADFAQVERLIDQARAAGVKLLALPEGALGGYLLSLDGTAEPPPAFTVDSPEIRRLAGLAGDLVVTAGYAERTVFTRARRSGFSASVRTPKLSSLVVVS